MAQSHDDLDATNGGLLAELAELQQFDAQRSQRLDQLRARAEQMTEAGTNRITAGTEDERAESDEEDIAGFGVVRRLPADPLCLRISIGEVAENVGDTRDGLRSYLVFRGDPRDVARVLEAAYRALERSQFSRG